MAFDHRAVRGCGTRGTDSGVCVIDLSDIWDGARGRAVTSAVAWVDCHAEVLPIRMRWSRAGLWIGTRRGTLLLDSFGARADGASGAGARADGATGDGATPSNARRG